MHQLLLILVILAKGTDQKKVPENPYIIDLIEELVTNGGKWIVAAAGSNGDPPPYNQCEEITITETGIPFGCILVAHIHKARKAKSIKISTVNEKNEEKILNTGPIHQYMIKGNNNSKLIKEFNNEVSWDSAVSSPMCWNPQTQRIADLRFVVTPIDGTTEHLYLVAAKARSPIPEYQVAILTKTKIWRKHLKKMIQIVNYRNFLQLESSTISGLFSRYSLPRVQMKCAEGFDMNNPHDTINQDILNAAFNTNSPPFPDKDFKTILVKHQK